MNVLGRKPDTSLSCKFSDLGSETAEMRSYIRLACQLGIMGVNTREFQPRVKVTRAQFGTVLSRSLWGDKYEQDVPLYLRYLVPYYKYHIQSLKSAGLITNTDPDIVELRSYVMIMLMRSKDGKKPSYEYSMDPVQQVVGNTSSQNTSSENVELPNTNFTKKELTLIKSFNWDYQFIIPYKKGQAEMGVKYLQYLLRVYGYYKGQIHGINTTETIEAVYKFQVEHGLMSKPSDLGAGLLGPKTRDVLNPMLKNLLHSNRGN